MALRHCSSAQHGAALLILLILLVAAALTHVVTTLTPAALQARRAQQTQAALVQAREALVGYALQYRDTQRLSGGTPDAMYGYLPLPDLGESTNLNAVLSLACASEGCAKFNAAGVSGNDLIVGRFPWKSVGADVLRDGHAECLWYAVSASHRAVNATAAVMNGDTPARPDILIGSGKIALDAAGIDERPLAVIFAPDPVFSGGRAGSAEAPLCGGNYAGAHYLNPALDNRQQAVPVTRDRLFGDLRKHAHFRADINALLERMAQCLRDELAAGGVLGPAGKIAGADDHPCYGKDIDPRGYYPHYRALVFVAPLMDGVAADVRIDGTVQPHCAGVLLFAGERDRMMPHCPAAAPTLHQRRTDAADQLAPCNYLEGVNLDSLGTGGRVFAGAGQFERSPPQAVHQDVVRCIPAGARLAELDNDRNADGVADFPLLARYAPATQTLTLGSASPVTSAAGAAKLFGCAWTPEAQAAGRGLRSYFRFRIRKRGEGFAFAIIDSERNAAGPYNAPTVCGAAGQHLGYSGDNGLTAYIQPPKLAVEFDTVRNAGFTEGGNLLTNGRNDPCYQTSCGATQNLQSNAHVAAVYWGYAQPNAADPVVSQPHRDDNVHGFPNPAALPFRPGPTSPPTALPLDRMGGTDGSKREFHVRIEVSLRADSAVDAAQAATQFELNVWIEPHPATSINAIRWTAGNPPSLTVTAPSHGFNSGNRVTIKDAVPVAYNGEYSVTRIDANNFSVTFPAGGVPGSGPGPGPYVRSINWTAKVAYVLSPAHGFSTGDRLTLAGAFPTEYNVSNVPVTRIDNDNYTFPLDLASDPGDLERAIVAAKLLPPRAEKIATITRPMRELDAAFNASLTHSATLLDEQKSACDPAAVCPAGQRCGADNRCYQPVFRNLRLGFTTGEQQSTATNARNQQIYITDHFTTWLP
jgi:hypothetical protein